MVKTFHGHTNYNRISRKCSYRTRLFEYMGNIMALLYLHDNCWRVRYGNEVIDFCVDWENKSIFPLRVINVIEDLDITTMVSGTKIVNKRVMRQADERLYNLLKNYIFELGTEIIQ